MVRLLKTHGLERLPSPIPPLLLSCAVLLIAGATPTSVQSAQLLVEPNGGGLFPTIQDAIDFANPGDVVVLANGVFTGPGNFDIDFGGKVITLRAQTGPRDLCILDPGVNQSIPHRAFLFQSGEPPDVVVEGITMRGGLASGSSGMDGAGGAVLCLNESRPTFRDCVFRENVASSNGGAVSSKRASPSFYGCLFEANDAPFGGAIYADQPCLLAAGLGEEPPLVIEGCRFLSNVAGDGGAIYSRGIHTDFILRETEFASNFADHGGALKLHGTTATIDRCTFVDNFGGAEGGAFAFENTVFCGPVELAGTGDDPVQVAITETLVCGNFSGVGGAALLRGYAVSFSQCTLVGNIGSVGSGIYAWSHFNEEPFRPSYLRLENTVIALGAGGAAIASDAASTVLTSCTDIFGNEGGDWVGGISEQLGIDGNLCEDPGFCNPENGDFTLRSDSPCQEYPGGCGLIGALPVSCGPAAVPDVAEEGVRGNRRPVALRIDGNPVKQRIDGAILLVEPSEVTLRLLDAGGRRLGSRTLGRLGAGEHRVSWSLDAMKPSAGSGTYFLCADTQAGSVTRKIVRLH